jgi:phage replication-related protein YjqB (UPF0714/DUF867 family)
MSGKHLKQSLCTLLGIALISISFICWATPARADYFNCFQTEPSLPQCLSEPILVDSCFEPPPLGKASCCLSTDQDEKDYSISILDRNSDITVLAIHGGRIEPNTTKISEELAGSPRQWNLYTFSGHGRSQCLLEGSLKKSNFGRLHITSTNFNDQRAIDLVKSHSKSVAIHGYRRPSYRPGVICVGGKNKSQRRAFISYIKANHLTFVEQGGYELEPIDATDDDIVLCDGLRGVDKLNIVNRNSEGKGLQLELSSMMRDNLANGTARRYKTLRNIIYSAIEKAMAV